jgi:ParB-like nuclease domain
VQKSDSIQSRRSLELKIEMRTLCELRANPRNARTHSKKQIRQIADSIEQFGFVNPVLVDDTGMIIAGHGRAAAANRLGYDSVPTVRLDHLSEAEKRAYVIADNRLAELAGWDQGLLAIELGELGALELNFDLTITGYEEPEIDLLLLNSTPPADPEDSFTPPDLTGPAVTKLGDLWLLGPHRLLCGDARDPAVYQRLMSGERARIVITDPPYNVPINGHVSGLGSAPPAKCRARTLSASWAKPSATWLPSASTAPCTMSAWIGGTCLSCWPPALLPMLS